MKHEKLSENEEKIDLIADKVGGSEASVKEERGELPSTPADFSQQNSFVKSQPNTPRRPEVMRPIPVRVSEKNFEDEFKRVDSSGTDSDDDTPQVSPEDGSSFK